MQDSTVGSPGAEQQASLVTVQRIRKASEQVADQLHSLMVGGQLRQNEKLPSEVELARSFGVSRSTVREALRQLSAKNLIRTVRGPSGGSFVTLPTVDHISDFLTQNIALLRQANHVSLDEFLAVREILEVPAAKLAAIRRNGADVEQLLTAIPSSTDGLSAAAQFSYNRDFHLMVVEASGNALLRIATQPIFSVLQTSLARSSLSRDFHGTVVEQHRELALYVADGDADAAAQAMRVHLEYLRPFYEKAWVDRQGNQAPGLTTD